MNKPVFITGIGTEIGKTVAAAIVTEALQADYWKPVQAGFSDGTDAGRVQSLVSNTVTVVHPEAYRLRMPASPHIAAAREGVEISLEKIAEKYEAIREKMSSSSRKLVIEGAGGLLVPLEPGLFIADLIARLGARVVLVSRNYLGSINHSLLTAAYCKQKGLDVAGWLFNDQYLDYADEIVQWTRYPKLGSIPYADTVDRSFVSEQAAAIRTKLAEHI
jgi:dethiobiotin synthetase